MTPDERRQIVETVVKQAAGRVPVLIGTGAEWTDEVVRTSREAESMGADGVMIIPPFYSVPTDDELYRPLQEGVGRDLDPDHGLQQSGDGQCRHACRS